MEEGGGIVFLLWGRPAGKKAETVVNRVTGPFARGDGKGKEKYVVIGTSHPSPLGATKTDRPFLGSMCFSRVNEALVGLGLDPVDWRVDGVEGDGIGVEGVDVSEV